MGVLGRLNVSIQAVKSRGGGISHKFWLAVGQLNHARYVGLLYLAQ